MIRTEKKKSHSSAIKPQHKFCSDGCKDTTGLAPQIQGILCSDVKYVTAGPVPGTEETVRPSHSLISTSGTVHLRLQPHVHLLDINKTILNSAYTLLLKSKGYEGMRLLYICAIVPQKSVGLTSK